MLHEIDTVIVGGGQAGLAISYYLTREGSRTCRAGTIASGA
jgi:cation diffusion facilitator CzcD-associated flavoprotein CzcO